MNRAGSFHEDHFVQKIRKETVVKYFKIGIDIILIHRYNIRLNRFQFQQRRRNMKKTKTKPVSQLPSEKELPAIKSISSGKAKVWNGKIGRLRIYDQPESTGKKVFAYKAPGENGNYVGYSDDPDIIQALFSARDNGKAISGYTNNQCRIEWIDY